MICEHSHVGPISHRRSRAIFGREEERRRIAVAGRRVIRANITTFGELRTEPNRGLQSWAKERVYVSSQTGLIHVGCHACRCYDGGRARRADHGVRGAYAEVETA